MANLTVCTCKLVKKLGQCVWLAAVVLMTRRVCICGTQKMLDTDGIGSATVRVVRPGQTISIGMRLCRAELNVVGVGR